MSEEDISNKESIIPEQKPQKPSLKITRRKFLELGSAAVAAMAAAAALEPVWIRLLPEGPEGNPAQRLRVFQDFSSEILTNRSAENIQALLAWIKLNAAEYYFSLKGNNITSLFIRHFLYGRGEPLNITDMFVDYLLRIAPENENYDIGIRNPTRNQILAGAFSSQLTKGIPSTSAIAEGKIKELKNAGWISEITGSDSKTREALINGELPEEPIDLKVKTVTAVRSMTFPDLYYSLRAYTLEVGGQIEEVNLPLGVDSYTIQIKLKQVKCRVYDRYDWANVEFKESAQIRDVIGPFLKSIGIADVGKTLFRLIGKSATDKFLLSEFDFDDQEGRLLEDKNLGRPFDVTATVDLPEITLKMRKDFFVKGRLEE